MNLVLTIAPRGPKGIFIGRIEGTALCIRATHDPLLAAAQSLLEVGVDPQTVLILRNFGSETNRISGPIEMIVQKAGKRTDKSRFCDGEVELDGRRRRRVARKSAEQGAECR